MQSRVIAVLQRVDVEGWTLLCPELDDSSIIVLNLHEHATELHEAV